MDYYLNKQANHLQRITKLTSFNDADCLISTAGFLDLLPDSLSNFLKEHIDFSNPIKTITNLLAPQLLASLLTKLTFGHFGTLFKILMMGASALGVDFHGIFLKILSGFKDLVSSAFSSGSKISPSQISELISSNVPTVPSSTASSYFTNNELIKISSLLNENITVTANAKTQAGQAIVKSGLFAKAIGIFKSLLGKVFSTITGALGLFVGAAGIATVVPMLPGGKSIMDSAKSLLPSWVPSTSTSSPITPSQSVFKKNPSLSQKELNSDYLSWKIPVNMQNEMGIKEFLYDTLKEVYPDIAKLDKSQVLNSAALSGFTDVLQNSNVKYQHENYMYIPESLKTKEHVANMMIEDLADTFKDKLKSA